MDFYFPCLLFGQLDMVTLRTKDVKFTVNLYSKVNNELNSSSPQILSWLYIAPQPSILSSRSIWSMLLKAKRLKEAALHCSFC
jgi:hypothetical protein